MNILKKILSASYILASKSSRRAYLLKQIGLKYRAIDPDVEELNEEDHDPVHIVRHNSQVKSQKVASDWNKEIVIGADTVVYIGNKILNKPSSKRQAVDYLKLLSGRKHYVYTGLNLINTSTGKEIFCYEKTEVYFRKLQDEEITFYVNNYPPLDKAGAYGIQDDFACLFVKKINGDFYNIVGLPLAKLYENLQKIV